MNLLLETLCSDNGDGLCCCNVVVEAVEPVLENTALSGVLFVAPLQSRLAIEINLPSSHGIHCHIVLRRWLEAVKLVAFQKLEAFRISHIGGDGVLRLARKLKRDVLIARAGEEDYAVAFSLEWRHLVGLEAVEDQWVEMCTCSLVWAPGSCCEPLSLIITSPAFEMPALVGAKGDDD